MKKFHLKNCQCLRCKLERGYKEMREINLAIANTYKHAEAEVNRYIYAANK